MSAPESESRVYKTLYTIAKILMYPFCRVRTFGLENIPEGAALFCANHSSYLDPFVICFSIGRLRNIHMIAKAELFKVPIIRGILKAIGTIPVDRGKNDTSAVRASLKYLNNGERIGIFPEGTRVSEANAVEAKLGAVKLAARTGAPIVPIYIPRRKSAFRTIKVIIGKPYHISSAGIRLEAEEYEQLSNELMEKIEQMKDAELNHD